MNLLMADNAMIQEVRNSLFAIGICQIDSNNSENTCFAPFAFK